MTNNEDNYNGKECPFAPISVIPRLVCGTIQTDAWEDPMYHCVPKYCNTTQCAAWQICAGDLNNPTYGCRLIERGYMF